MNKIPISILEYLKYPVWSIFIFVFLFISEALNKSAKDETIYVLLKSFINMEKTKMSTRIKLIPESYEVMYQGSEVRLKLEPLPFNLLRSLIENNHYVCTSSMLIEQVWKGDERVGRPALRRNIYKLRKQLNQLNPSIIIENIPKKGYRLKYDPRKENTNLKIHRYLWMSSLAILFLVIILVLIRPALGHELIHSLRH